MKIRALLSKSSQPCRRDLTHTQLFAIQCDGGNRGERLEEVPQQLRGGSDSAEVDQ